MIGILFLVTVALWLIACVLVAGALGRLVPGQKWRLPGSCAILLALLSAPLVDEAVGKHQFEALCKANGIESADPSKARGKRVKVQYGERRPLDETIVPIKESDVRFVDADSGLVLIEHKNYYASGGWVMRHTWLSLGSNTPMLFDGSTCDLRREQKVFKENAITFLYE